MIAELIKPAFTPHSTKSPSTFNPKPEYSGPRLPPIPVEGCHPFRLKVATDSGEGCHPLKVGR